MNVILVTDFTDYYDHMLGREGLGGGAPTAYLYRQATNYVHRQAALEYLWRDLRLRTPDFGIHLPSLARTHGALVAHTDPYAHRAEGKVLVPAGEEPPPGTVLGVQYIQPWEPSTSYRLLHVGGERFALRYRSMSGDWRSNAGEVEIAPALAVPTAPRLVEYPLLAIDYVLTERDGWYAVDLNTAPGLRGTPVEDQLTATEVAGLIEAWFDAKQRRAA